MDYSFSYNLRDSDGDVYDNGLFVYCGKHTIIRFKDSDELESFARRILRSLSEIRECYEPQVQRGKIEDYPCGEIEGPMNEPMEPKAN